MSVLTYPTTVHVPRAEFDVRCVFDVRPDVHRIAGGVYLVRD